MTGTPRGSPVLGERLWSSHQPWSVASAILRLFFGKQDRLLTGARSPLLCHHPQQELSCPQGWHSSAMGTSRTLIAHDCLGTSQARGPWLSVGLLALFGALGREPHANQKRMENSCGSLEKPHSYEQPTPASKRGSSSHGMKF